MPTKLSLMVFRPRLAQVAGWLSLSGVPRKWKISPPYCNGRVISRWVECGAPGLRAMVHGCCCPDNRIHSFFPASAGSTTHRDCSASLKLHPNGRACSDFRIRPRPLIKAVRQWMHQCTGFRPCRCSPYREIPRTAGDAGLIVRRHGEVAIVPTAENTQALKIPAMQFDGYFFSVFAAFLANFHRGMPRLLCDLIPGLL